MDWSMDRETVSRLIVVLVALIGADTMSAQSLEIRSEFRRYDPFGQLIPNDGQGRPREILSPLVLRGAKVSFQLIVDAPPDKEFTIHVGQNPEGATTATLYRASYHQAGERWLPDSLTPVELPLTTRINEQSSIPGQRSQTYWLDLDIPPDLKPGRMRVEAQLFFDGRWQIYPMEIRVSEVIAKNATIPKLDLPPLTSGAVHSAFAAWRTSQCGEKELISAGHSEPDVSIRGFIARNAWIDVQLAQQRGMLLDRQMWCGGTAAIDADPEWYLKLRGHLWK